MTLNEFIDNHLQQPISENVVNGALERINSEMWRDVAPIYPQPNPVLYVQGWTIDMVHGSVSENVFVALQHENGTIYATKAERYERPDLVQHFGNELYRMAGLRSYALVNEIPHGVYTMFIVQEIDGVYYYYQADKQIQIWP